MEASGQSMSIAIMGIMQTGPMAYQLAPRLLQFHIFPELGADLSSRCARLLPCTCLFSDERDGDENGGMVKASISSRNTGGALN
jgi:hypothetical protein